MPIRSHKVGESLLTDNAKLFSILMYRFTLLLAVYVKIVHTFTYLILSDFFFFLVNLVVTK